MKLILTITLTLLHVVLSLSCSTDRTSSLDPSPSVFPSPPPIDSSLPKKIGSLVKAQVISVIDGTTIEVDVERRIHRVRYLGIRIPKSDRQSRGERSFEQEALEFNRFLVEGVTVELEEDDTGSDHQGILLRYVYVNGEMVNISLLTNGYVTVDDFPTQFKYRTHFLIAEETAKNSFRGIWNPSHHSTNEQATTTPVTFSGGTLPRPRRSPVPQICDYSGTVQPVIKGNTDTSTSTHIYYVPGDLFYSTTVINKSHGDRWFCTEEEAVNAGWQQAKR